VSPEPLILVAAGGAGTRLGGNKPLARLGGRRLIDHALAFAGSQGEIVVLAAPAPIPGIACTVLPDPAPDLGPIGALLAGMAAAERRQLDRVLMIGCDQPFLPADLLARLAAALSGHGAAVPRRAGHLQPLAALWRVDRPALAAFVAGGGRALHGFAAARGFIAVDWSEPGPDPFANVNTPADLAAAAARFTPAR
jgi:molybdopterin-guanine dinucleotide biosynthesis protein A